MILVIDNYDSYVYNLVAYLRILGAAVEVARNDAVSVAEILHGCEDGSIAGILISPGPKRPEDSGVCLEMLQQVEGRLPVLGVCLGHQIIGHYYGAAVRKGQRPMHGKITPILHNGAALFAGLPQRFGVTRYHSLIIDAETVPPCLSVDAVAEDGAVMAVSHRHKPVYGLQFHPEAVLTEFGLALLDRFLKKCTGGGNRNEDPCTLL